MLDALDVDAVRRWSRTAVDLLALERARIDALNVYPVADSDTGTNMLATMRAGADRLGSGAASGASGAFRLVAEGAAAGAQGNSGFITSQLLMGLADAAAAAGDPDLCTAGIVAAGLVLGAQLARDAVVDPVDGTMLSVAQAAAGVARGGAPSGDPNAPSRPASLADVLQRAVAAADAALQRTTAQLPELGRAGVVDAGGLGYLVLLDALVRTVTGAPAARTRVPFPPPLAPVALFGDAPASLLAAPRFEVQYLLAADAHAIPALQSTLAALGDSVAVVALAADGSGVDRWNVHVHVDDVGAAIETGVLAGRPHQIQVTELRPAASHESDRPERPRQPDEPDRPAHLGTAPVAVLAIAPGVGLGHLFEGEGVTVVDGGADDLPSVADVVTAIEKETAGDIVLLPNASRVTGIAEAAAAQARARGWRVSVVPTRSAVQGLAAVAVHDAARLFDDDVVAMAEAAAATRYAEICVADSAGLTAAGMFAPGDVLGLIDGEVVAVGRGLLAVAFTVLDRLVAVGAELITVLVGAEAPGRAGELLEAHVRGRAPFTDVVVYAGGQQPLIVGVE